MLITAKFQQFKNYNGSGNPRISLKHQLTPLVDLMTKEMAKLAADVKVRCAKVKTATKPKVPKTKGITKAAAAAKAARLKAQKIKDEKKMAAKIAQKKSAAKEKAAAKKVNKASSSLATIREVDSHSNSADKSPTDDDDKSDSYDDDHSAATASDSDVWTIDDFQEGNYIACGERHLGKPMVVVWRVLGLGTKRKPKLSLQSMEPVVENTFVGRWTESVFKTTKRRWQEFKT